MQIVPDEDKINQRISEARQLSIAAPIILPMLEKRKQNAFGRLMSNHRDGKPVDHNAIAELFVINGLQSEIRSKLEDLNLK